jgi:transcriptional regulator with XRE-family HTH domain
MKVSPNQCRAARGLLNWTQADLADKARVVLLTINNFERSAVAVKAETYDKIVQALMAAGIAFHANGVSLVPPVDRFLRGANPVDPETRKAALAILNSARKRDGRPPLVDDYND